MQCDLAVELLNRTFPTMFLRIGFYHLIEDRQIRFIQLGLASFRLYIKRKQLMGDNSDFFHRSSKCPNLASIFTMF